jgi:hypothetical protein
MTTSEFASGSLTCPKQEAQQNAVKKAYSQPLLTCLELEKINTANTTRIIETTNGFLVSS